MRIRFDRGTLVLEPERDGEDPATIGAQWDDDVHGWRVPADRHRELVRTLPDVTDEVRIVDLAPDFAEPKLRWYQQAALDAWRAAGHHGIVALPTGSGKTHVAIAAMAKLGVATLVLVPTRVLLDQWARVLAAFWPHPIGRLGDGDHAYTNITVATYASATTWMQRIGDRFGLVVIDEAHHVGAWCPRDILEMVVAPARLGLTATPPELPFAPVVYALGPRQLVGDGLADWDHAEVSVQLDRRERARYRELRGTFGPAYAKFMKQQPHGTWNQFVRECNRTKIGREALAAWRGSREVIAYPAAKRAALREILTKHLGERTLVFTSDNATAYAIARELLVMPITHEIGRAERARALQRFRDGDAPVLVSAQVLDEGLDVPDADIAIVVGGSSSKRREVQRIGRVLRPREGKRAVVYELSVSETVEVDYVKRRREGFDATLVGGAP
jgi:superfamily II DNA or RNA helicase